MLKTLCTETKCEDYIVYTLARQEVKTETKHIRKTNSQCNTTFSCSFTHKGPLKQVHNIAEGFTHPSKSLNSSVPIDSMTTSV